MEKDYVHIHNKATHARDYDYTKSKYTQDQAYNYLRNMELFGWRSAKKPHNGATQQTQIAADFNLQPRHTHLAEGKDLGKQRQPIPQCHRTIAATQRVRSLYANSATLPTRNTLEAITQLKQTCCSTSTWQI